MAFELRPAASSDVPALVALMRAFYAEANFPLPPGPAAAAFQSLVANPHLGGAWLAVASSDPVGHVVLTACFSMEYGGLRGFIDDLYVRPTARGHGVGAALLQAARADATRRGLRALHVEVGPDNAVARRLYARAAYVDSQHLLLTLPLAAPLHAT